MAHNHTVVGKKILFGSPEYWAMANATEESLKKDFPDDQDVKEEKQKDSPKEKPKEESKSGFFKKKK